MELVRLLAACAPLVAPDTAIALIDVESGGNPYAIGVVGGALQRQPTNRADAIATARALDAAGWNFSVGLTQINKGNFARYGLSLESAFDACSNVKAMQGVLGECFGRAHRQRGSQTALRQSFSCYYSGNFHTGFEHGYVTKVLSAWKARQQPTRPQATGRSARPGAAAASPVIQGKEVTTASTAPTTKRASL